MKKVLALTLTIAMLAMALTSCFGGANKPEDVALKFAEALMSLNYKEAAKYVVDSEEFEEEYNEELEEAVGAVQQFMQDVLLDKVTFEVKGEAKYEDNETEATVTLVMTTPDMEQFGTKLMEKVLKDGLDIDMEDLFSDNAELTNDLKNIIKDVINDIDKTTEEEIEIELEKKDGKWLVSDFDA